MAISNRADRVLDMMDELIDREETYAAFLDASPWGILVVDITFHIVYANDTFQKMSGYTMKELVGNHLHMLMPKEVRKKHVQHEKAYVKAPRARAGNHGLEPRVMTKDKQLLDVEISIAPTRVRGQQMFFASIRPLETLFDTIEGKVKGT